MQEFTAEIKIIGVNPYVLLPDNILKHIFSVAKREKGPIPVVLEIEGNRFTQTLVKYQGLWRLYINGPMMKHAEKRVGDIITLSIGYDSKPRIEKMPKEFALALDQQPKVKDIYQQLAPYRKKEILRYLNSMKTKESLIRNIEKVIKHLLGEKVEGLYALMRRKEE